MTTPADTVEANNPRAMVTRGRQRQSTKRIAGDLSIGSRQVNTKERCSGKLEFFRKNYPRNRQNRPPPKTLKIPSFCKTRHSPCGVRGWTCHWHFLGSSSRTYLVLGMPELRTRRVKDTRMMIFAMSSDYTKPQLQKY